MSTMEWLAEDSLRDEVRNDLHAAVRARHVASKRYEEALVKARSQGWTNSDIARAVGVSEAAIRLYWVRHPQLKERVGR